MDRLFKTAIAANLRFPDGNTPFMIVTRLLEECGEVASEVNHWEDTGIKRQKHGEPSKESLAGEIRQAMGVLAQLAIYYNVEAEVIDSIERSLAHSRAEGLID